MTAKFGIWNAVTISQNNKSI